MEQTAIPLSGASSRLCWYVVWCKPRQEAIAEQNLKFQGFDVYLPRIQVRKRRRNLWIDSVQVLFPRYLFVRVDRVRQSTASIRSTRGALGLVRFGVEPVVVPDRVVEAIVFREDTATGLHGDSRREFRTGELVTMIDGPFAGMEGIFASDDGDERAVLLIELLGKINRVSLSRDWVAQVA